MWRRITIVNKISIIIPALNEAETIETSLNRLQVYRQQGHEIVVVDGGSSDKTAEISQPLVDQFLLSEPGRAIQMNLGAKQASGNLLLFLHVDTIVSDSCFTELLNLELNKKIWGRFDVKLSNSKFIYKVIAFFMNLRSRITSIATGDQCIFITKKLFSSIKGYPEVALMEDIAISKKLRKYHKPICLKETVVTSARRWEKNGVLKTILLMWYLRLAYFFNVSPKKLNALYEK